LEQISVIVPIFNNEEFVEKCVRSILAQTHPNLQIVLVNDGSTDSSLQICQRLRDADERVLVVDKEHSGTVHTRQRGLSVATGEWIGWVDADDWVEQDYFLQLAESQVQTGADIIAADLYIDIGYDSQRVSNTIPKGVYKCDQILSNLIYSGRFFEYGLQPHLVTKLIRKKILEKTQPSVDQRIRVGEDIAVVYPSVLEAEAIAVTDICGYHYVQHANSVTKVLYQDERESLQHLMNYLYCTAEKKRVFTALEPQLAQLEKYLMFLRLLPLLDQQILLPYGGIPYHSRVVIYGAGVSGQQIYRYLSDSHIVDVTLWVDKNAAYYQNESFPVCLPEAIKGLGNEYDYVLIANTSESSAGSIQDFLVQLQVPPKKIRWFSQAFLGR